MKTFSFIGSDKNAGKTTMFNFVYRKMLKAQKKVCLSSIGINGEKIDTYEGHKKPEICFFKDTFFITANEHLKNKTGQYKILFVFRGISKTYIMGKCLSDFSIVLEGPNTGMELKKLKAMIRKMQKKKKGLKIDIFLIDGSVDRQFLARPDISDGFYFSLLITKRKEQRKKANGFLRSLYLGVCNLQEKIIIKTNLQENTRSLLFYKNANKIEILFHGTKIVSLDPELKKKCLNHKDKNLYLYINGALSGTLAVFLSQFKNMTLILDNFTQYLNISVCEDHEKHEKNFLPEIYLFHKIKVKKIFLKQKNNIIKPYTELFENKELKFCKNISIHNLYRENTNEIVI